MLPPRNMKSLYSTNRFRKNIYIHFTINAQMKSALFYTLKVCLATLLTSAPVTMAIGFAYIGLITLIKPLNYIFNFHLLFSHVFLFVAILAALIMLNRYLIAKVGYKRFINDRPVAHSIVIFLLYLVISGSVRFISFDYLLFSYAPMFLTAYVFSRIFSETAKKEFWNLLNGRHDDGLKPLSDQ